MEPYSFWLMLKGAPLAKSCFGGSHSLDKPYRCVSKNSSEKPSERITFNGKTQGLGRTTILITCMGIVKCQFLFAFRMVISASQDIQPNCKSSKKAYLGAPLSAKAFVVYVSPWRFPYNLMI